MARNDVTGSTNAPFWSQSGETKKGRTPGGVRPFFYSWYYLVTLVTVPAPTVRPPSRMAKPRPSSIAMG